MDDLQTQKERLKELEKQQGELSQIAWKLREEIEKIETQSFINRMNKYNWKILGQVLILEDDYKGDTFLEELYPHSSAYYHSGDISIHCYDGEISISFSGDFDIMSFIKEHGIKLNNIKNMEAEITNINKTIKELELRKDELIHTLKGLNKNDI